MEKVPRLSVVIPAYREGERIGRTLLEIEEYFSHQEYTYEIIVVVDGSPDNTAEITRNYGSQVKHLHVVENEQNRGKGYVVRQGLKEARGEYRLFMDADGSTSIAHLDRFLPEIEKPNVDVVVGSRSLPESYIQVHQPFFREFFGRVGNLLIRSTLGLLPFHDTQCGFKILTDRAACAVTERMVVDRFGFDYELIVLAKKLGFTVVQLPVRWLNEEGTTVTIFGPNGFVQVFVDLFKTKCRLIADTYRIKEFKTRKINKA